MFAFRPGVWVLCLVLWGLCCPVSLAAAKDACVLQSEVLEVINFTLPKQNISMMLKQEERTWNPYLKKKAGFVSKTILVRHVRGSLQVTLLIRWKDRSAHSVAEEVSRKEGPLSVYPGIAYQGGGVYDIYACK